MKQNFTLQTILCGLLLLTLFSCEKVDNFEPLPFVEPIQIDRNNYFPGTVGNLWEYESVQGKKATIEVVNTNEYNGERFFEINQINGSYAGIRKVNSIYEIRLEGTANTGASYTGSGTHYKTVLFDHNAEVGTTWEDELTYSVSFVPKNNAPARETEDHTVTVKSQLISRTPELSIMGQKFDDVLEIRLEQKFLGKTEISTYYFANHVGIIRYTQGLETVQLANYNLR